jgi:hypothetical protein
MEQPDWFGDSWSFSGLLSTKRTDRDRQTPFVPPVDLIVATPALRVPCMVSRISGE